MGFFSRRKARSVTKAKERLISVIKTDRINIVDNDTMEKIRKDITAVIQKHIPGSDEIMINISSGQGNCIVLNARVNAV